MADPRFFKVAGPFTLKELAALINIELKSSNNSEFVYEDIAPLATAGPKDVSFFENKKYSNIFRRSKAGVCIVDREAANSAPEGMELLVTPKPYESYALIAQAFYPKPLLRTSIANSATIDSSAVVSENCLIEAGAIIGARVELASACHIGANVVVGEAVTIGENSTIGAGAVLSHCQIGSRVFIHPGVRIGQRGFGFAISETGHVKVPQLGRVIVEDDVEIGANSTVDRGSGPDTVIGKGSMIDNLVQIGHNVHIGPGCVIVAQSGIAGSTTLGKLTIIGGQSAVSGHLVIGEGAQIGGKSGVMRDVSPGEKVAGIPAMPIKEHFRQVATIKKLARKLNEKND